MNIVSINMTHAGSTGTIMREITRCARLHNYQAISFSLQGGAFSIRNFNKYRTKTMPEFENHEYYGSYITNSIHVALGKAMGLNGCFSIVATRKLMKRISELNPDIIHLHNLHGFCINIPMLFRYIKKHHIPTVWTLHDCWTFTGHCPYFTLAKCNKWKTGCHDCPNYREYPKSSFDNSKMMWRLKRKWFSGVENMTIVTPSHWLADLVKQSYLKDYPVKVIHNGIDLSVFKPTINDFREKHGIAPDKKLLLGVAAGWGKRKGLDVFIELAKRLPEKYQIVLVGTEDATDKCLPKNILSIHRTQNQRELAEIYTAADCFVNPTREENYPTVNLEAIACGTPVITFNTGGSPECVDETCGSVIPCDDVDALEAEIVRVCRDKPYSSEACVTRARSFDMNERFDDYVKLYEGMVE